MNELKRILIVDDSEIDREVLKSILEDEFELIEADNGYTALNIILKKRIPLDAVLLDISMPFLDGFSVLQILRENNFRNVSIFMITAEATKDNVEKALQYHIVEFIKKPFNREDILNRVRSKLGVVPEDYLTMADIDETRMYMSNLESVYKRWLSMSGKDKGRDERRAQFMRMLVTRYFESEKKTEVDDFQIEMYSKAAYLCNIGEMLLPSIPPEEDKMEDYQYQQHTALGAEFIKLNYSEHCRRFVRICSDICQHHHERYDGEGFPQGMRGNNISVYAQMCGLLERFDDLFFNYSRHNKLQFDYVVDQIVNDTGFVSNEVIVLLLKSETDIVEYYKKNYV